jgi:Glyoxalase-like domain
VASADLDEAIATVAAATGVRAAMGGAHAGQGTHNALASFGDGSYLELIGPDPAQSDRPLGDRFVGLTTPTVVLFVVRTDDHAAKVAAMRAAGFDSDVMPLSRLTPDGDMLSWHMVRTTGHGIGPLMPMFIDWGAMPHPSEVNPGGLSLDSFTVVSDRPEDVKEVYRRAGIDGIDVVAGDGPGFAATISGPGGSMDLPGAPIGVDV